MNLIRIKLENMLRKGLRPVFNMPYLRGFYNYEQQEKIIKTSVTVIDVGLMIGTFIAMMIIFQKMRTTLGYESTSITLLIIIAFLLRNFLEVNSAKSQSR